MDKHQIEYLKTANLIPNARNAKTHPEAQVAQIAGSIKAFGFLAPIVIDGDNVVIVGNGRQLAAQKLGLEEVPCIRADKLSKTELKAFALADNKIQANSEFDQEMLKLEFEDLKLANFDLDLTGFNDLEQNELLQLGDTFNNDLEDKDQKDSPGKYILEIEFPDEQAMRDEYEDLVSKGLIVRFK